MIGDSLPSLSHTVIDIGPAELVYYLLDKKKRHVAEKFSSRFSNTQSSPEDSNIDDFENSVYFLMESHLDYIAPYRSSWADALQCISTPSQIVRSSQRLQELGNDFCLLTDLSSKNESVDDTDAQPRIGQNRRGPFTSQSYVEKGALVSLYCSAGMLCIYAVYASHQ
jgi:hypothetical protein